MSKDIILNLKSGEPVHFVKKKVCKECFLSKHSIQFEKDNEVCKDCKGEK